MGANIKANCVIVTTSKTAPAAGIHQIKSQFDKTTKIHALPWAHSTRTATGMMRCSCLRLAQIAPFSNYAQQILWAAFQRHDIVSTGKFFSWLEQHKKQIIAMEGHAQQCTLAWLREPTTKYLYNN